MNSHSCYRCLAPRCFAIKKAKEVLERVTPRKKEKGEREGKREREKRKEGEQERTRSSQREEGKTKEEILGREK
jgi:hypothetical protein